MKKENFNDYVFNSDGRLATGEQGFPLKKVGIEYRDAGGKDYMLRLENDDMISVRRFVKDYIRNHKTGCWLCLPGGKLDMPMQVEFLFENKDSHLELSEAYDFFKNLRKTAENFTYVRLLMVITREEALEFQLTTDAPALVC